MPQVWSLMRLLALLLPLAVAACGDPTTLIDCSLRVVAKMPLVVQDHLMVVPAGINGQWVKFVVDTGAERTTLPSATAGRLSLPRDARFTTRSLGVGGVSSNQDVTIE